MRGLLAVACLCALPLSAQPGPAAGEGAALALRREYNGVAAAIDSLVRRYSQDRLSRLADEEATPGVQLPPAARLVLLIWADDEAMVYLNGAPVGQTRLTPTRIEIPTAYIESDNRLVARCRDTDRVESGFMAGLYVEDPAGLRPVLTTTEAADWQVAAGPQAGEPAREIFYAHSQPDLPGAQVMWGPQLFGEVELSVRFAPQDIEQAVRRAPLAASMPRLRDRPMDYHTAVSRLVGLQERRRELATRLRASAPSGAQRGIRARVGAGGDRLTYTLGSAAPLDEGADTEVERALSTWTRQLPPSTQELVLHEARALQGERATTPPAPLPETAGTGEADRRTEYVPPAELGTTGEGSGTSQPGSGGGTTVVRRLAPSASFLWRMTAIALLLSAWTAVHGWRGWALWRSADWKESKG